MTDNVVYNFTVICIIISAMFAVYFKLCIGNSMIFKLFSQDTYFLYVAVVGFVPQQCSSIRNIAKYNYIHFSLQQNNGQSEQVCTKFAHQKVQKSVKGVNSKYLFYYFLFPGPY